MDTQTSITYLEHTIARRATLLKYQTGTLIDRDNEKTLQVEY